MTSQKVYVKNYGMGTIIGAGNDNGNTVYGIEFKNHKIYWFCSKDVLKFL